MLSSALGPLNGAFLFNLIWIFVEIYIMIFLHIRVKYLRKQSATIKLNLKHINDLFIPIIAYTSSGRCKLVQFRVNLTSGSLYRSMRDTITLSGTLRWWS